MVSNQVAFSSSLCLDNCVHLQGNARSVAIETVNNIAIQEFVATERKIDTNSQSGSGSESGVESKI